MISFGMAKTQFQNLAQDTSDAALTFFGNTYNIGLHEVEDRLETHLTEETWTDLTEDGVYSYPTLDQFVKLNEAFITIGTTTYPPLIQVTDEAEWINLRTDIGEADPATHIFVRGDTFELYPTPGTDDNTITLRAEMGGKDLSFDDSSTGTILTLTNDTTAVVGSDTDWTTAMIGRYFKINAFPVWYKISGVADTTHLTLAKAYQGVSIAAGTSAYTIGEMPRTPGTTHQIPVWYAMMNYYLGFKQNQDKAAFYKGMYESDIAKLKPLKQKRKVSNYIPGNRRRLRITNPNHYPRDLS